jgi:hypothetical protein
MSRNISTGAALAISALFAGTATAELIYEPFDYTSGAAIAGQTNTYSAGSPVWNHAGTATTPVHEVISGSLTGPSALPPSVGNAAATHNADNTEFNRLDLPASYGTNTTLYYSLLLQIPDLTGLTTANTNLNANNDGIIMFNNATGTSASRPSNWAGELVIRLGSQSGTYNLGIRASNTPANTNPGHTYWSPDITANNDIHFIVVRYVQGASDNLGSDDSNDLWINPSSANFALPEGSVPAPDGSAQGTINAGSPTNNFAKSILIGSGIAAGAVPNTVNLDEIRVGETWAEVTPVPEPSSLAVLGLAGLLATRRRRRAC